jgi:hypothetical protein
MKSDDQSMATDAPAPSCSLLLPPPEIALARSLILIALPPHLCQLRATLALNARDGLRFLTPL